MAQKRPRDINGAAFFPDDTAHDAIATKRQHVEQPEQRSDDATQSDHATVHAITEQPGSNTTTGDSSTVDVTAPIAPAAAPQPAASSQRVIGSALLFQPRQLLTTVTAAAATATPRPPRHHEPIAAAAAHELPVLRTIDWRSTEAETEEEEGDGMEDDSGLQYDNEDGGEDELEADEHGGSMPNSAADMENGRSGVTHALSHPAAACHIWQAATHAYCQTYSTTL